MAEFHFRERRCENGMAATLYTIEVTVGDRRYTSTEAVDDHTVKLAVDREYAIRYAKRRCLYNVFEQLIEEQWPTT